MKIENSRLYKQAEKYIRQKQYDEAIEILESIYEEEPSSDIINYQLAKLYLNKKINIEEALMMLEQLSHEKNNSPAALLLGRYYAGINENAKAIEEFGKLFRTDVELHAVFEMGKIFLKVGNNKEAKKCFEYLLDKYDDVYSMFELGKIYMNEKNYQVARDYLERVLDKKFDNYTYFQLGKLEEEEDNLEEAADIFYEILEKNPNDAYSMFELGKIESIKGNTFKARCLFEKILKIKKGKDIPTLYELGKLDVKEGYFKNAKEKFNKVLEIKPDDLVSKLEIANLYVNEGDNKNASIIYDELINNHDYDLARLNYLNILCIEGHFDEAKKVCEEMIEKNDSVGARLTIGRIYALEGDFELARKIFKDLINNYNEEYAYFELVYLLIKENKLEEAYELFKKIPTRFRDYSIYLNLELFLEYHLGICTDPEWLETTYFGSQLHDYSYEKLYEHIMKHQDENDSRIVYKSFNNDVDLYSLFEEAITKKEELNPTQRFLLEKYVIECDTPVATVDGEEIKYIVANFMPDSNKIISMYPLILSNKELVNNKNKIYIKE